MSARMPIASSADPVRAAAAIDPTVALGSRPSHPLVSRRDALPGVRRVRRRSSGGHHGRMATLLSVNVGLPRDVTWNGQTVHTGIWKQPVAGR